MKKFFITLFLAVACASTLMAAESPYSLTWQSGDSYSTSQLIDDMTVQALGTVWGTFPEGTTIVLNADENARVATLSGSGDFSGSYVIDQAMKYNAETQQVEGLPAIKLRFGSYGSPVRNTGEYTASIPAGAFTVDGTANVAFDVTFYVEDRRVFTPIDLGCKADPAEGTYDFLDAFGVVFNNVDSNGDRIYTNKGEKNGVKATLRKDGVVIGEYDIQSVAAFTSQIKFAAKLPKGTKFLESGTYTITFPEGAFLLEEIDGPGLFTNEELTYTYVVENTLSINLPDDLIWWQGSSYSTRTPIHDMTVNTLQTVWADVPDGFTLDIPKVNGKEVAISGPNGYTNVTTLSQARSYNAETEETTYLNAFKIDFNPSKPSWLDAPGVYTAEVPADAFTLNGTPNPAFSVSFTLKDTRNFVPVELDCQAVPAPGEYEKLVAFNVNIHNVDANGSRIYMTLGEKYGAQASIYKDGELIGQYPIVSRSTSTGDLRFGIKLPTSQEYYQPGTYTVVYPEGSFLLSLNGKNEYYTNKELTYVYVVNPNSVYRPIVTPEPGSTIPALANIRLEVPEENVVFVLPEGTTFKVTTPDGTEKEYAASLSPNSMYMFIRGDEILYKPGKYTVTIPEGSFQFNNGYKTEGVRLLRYEYDVTGGELGELAYQVTNPDGDVITDNTNLYELSFLYVKFDKDVIPTQNFTTKVTRPDGTTYQANTSWSDANKRFLIDLGFPSQKGKYEIAFPAAAACADGVFNEEIKFAVNSLVRAQEELKFTTTPDNNTQVDNLQMIYINLDPEEYVSATRSLGGITISYLSKEGSDERPESCYIQSTDNSLNYYIMLDKVIEEPGDYCWTIPAKSFTVEKADGLQVVSNEIKAFWYIRNVKVVENLFDASVESFDVYTIQGRTVMLNADREQLSTLEKGVYIINGKTVVII